MRLRVTRLAQLDVDQIHDQIAADKPSAALRWVQRTRQQFKFLARNPGVGEARDDVRPAIRSISHGNYVILFRVKSDALEIVRVVHGRRDINALF
jgi:toxin ParE1/3/4